MNMRKVACNVVWMSMLLTLGAQAVEITAKNILLPHGNVLGAAFYEEKGIFVVQQNVLSTEDGGLAIRSQRQLTTWNIKNGSMLKKRRFAQAARGTPAYPCGRVEISRKLKRVILCSAASHLEIIDPETLETVSTVAAVEHGSIIDFGVDDAHDRLLVLTHGNGAVRLVSYSLTKGDEQTALSLQGEAIIGASLAVADGNGAIGIAINMSNRRGNNAEIYICSLGSHITCASVGRTEAVSQVAFLGNRLLLATSKFADEKRACVLSVDERSRSISPSYCSPRTGVHYAVAVVDRHYVVAFTGMSKRNWLTEENSSSASSFSVWREESPNVSAAVSDATDYGAFQNELRVVGSRTAPFFITFQRTSNKLRLHTIRDH
jgi:hypothetical protein